MATKAVSAVAQAAGVVNFATGKFTSDNNDALITLGFVPRHVRIFNETDAILWEKFAGMADANTAKVVSHDTAQVTKDTGSAIVINTDGTVALSSTLCGNSKVINWAAWG